MTKIYNVTIGYDTIKMAANKIGAIKNHLKAWNIKKYSIVRIK